MGINASNRLIEAGFLGKSLQTALIVSLLSVVNGCRDQSAKVLQKPENGHPTALKDETQNESHVLQQSDTQGIAVKTSEELQKPEWMKNLDKSRSYAKEAKEHQEAGRLEEAIVSLTKGIECNQLVLEEKDLVGVDILATSNVRKFLEERAKLHQELKQFDLEVGDYQQYADFNNENDQPEFNNYVLCDHAFALQNLEKWSEAIAKYEQAIEAEIFPPDPRAAFALSELYRTCPDPDFRNDELAAKYAQVAQDTEIERQKSQERIDAIDTSKRRWRHRSEDEMDYDIDEIRGRYFRP
jgi:tetratricopeptide (TPR) repeat protein